MSESEYRSIELTLAESPTDLVEALKAAQFARFILPDEDASEAEAKVIQDFVDAFAAATEVWDHSEPADRAALLAGIGGRLQALEQRGLHVHAAATTLALPPGHGQDELPVAILTIDRDPAPTLTTMIPRTIDLGGSPSTH